MTYPLPVKLYTSVTALVVVMLAILSGCTAPPAADAPAVTAPGDLLQENSGAAAERPGDGGTGSCTNDADCTVGGCSGTLCTLKGAPPMMSTCEWREEYACYQTIPCGCADGTCTWKTTSDFDSCVQEKSALNP